MGAKIFSRQLIQASNAHQLHVALNLSPEVVERLFHTFLAGGGQGIEVKPASRNSFGSNRQGLENVSSALNSALADNVDLVTNGIADLSELIEWDP